MTDNEHDWSDLTLDERLDMAINSSIASAAEARGLRQEVRVIGMKQAQDRKLIRLITGVLGMVIFLACLGAYNTLQNDRTIQSVKNSTSFIRDCIVPGGKCTANLSASSSLNRDIIVLRIREGQLQTSIDAAAAAGNGETTGKVYKEDLAEVQAQLKSTEQALLNIGKGQDENGQ